MKLEKQAVKIDSTVVEPRHIIEILCPACGRDIDETELTAQQCSDCGHSLEKPKQSVSIFATSKPIGTKVWGK